MRGWKHGSIEEGCKSRYGPYCSRHGSVQEHVTAKAQLKGGNAGVACNVWVRPKVESMSQHVGVAVVSASVQQIGNLQFEYGKF
jgi:hypothetical protein